MAAIAVLIAVVIGWQQAEERHDLRRQARLLMMTEASTRNELEQMRQAAGTLAALTARMTAQQQELSSALESARAQAQAQLVHVQQDLRSTNGTLGIGEDDGRPTSGGRENCARS